MKHLITRTLTTALLLLILGLVAAPTFAAEPQVNINTATATDLQNLPRIGPALSGRIIEFRDENGAFKSTDDLMLVRGIGERTYALMEPFVAIDGETTLTSKVSTAQAEEAMNGSEQKDEPKSDDADNTEG